MSNIPSTYYDYRAILYDIFSKLSDDDLNNLISIHKKLGLFSVALTFAIEILEDRNSSLLK